MPSLTPDQIDYLRKTYERLGPHQGIMASQKRDTQVLSADELREIIEYNDSSPEKWPTFTDLESHLRNIATMKKYGVPVPLY